MVQLINGLDFVFLCVAVWLCTIENQSLKHKKKAFKPRKKLHHNIYLRPFYRTYKDRNNSIQSTTVFLFVLFLFCFMKMTKSLVGFQVLNRVHERGCVTEVQFILFNFVNYSPSIAMELKVSKEFTGK